MFGAKKRVLFISCLGKFFMSGSWDWLKCDQHFMNFLKKETVVSFFLRKMLSRGWNVAFFWFCCYFKLFVWIFWNCLKVKILSVLWIFWKYCELFPPENAFWPVLEVEVRRAVGRHLRQKIWRNPRGPSLTYLLKNHKIWISKSLKSEI